MTNITDLKRTVETYAEFTGSEGDLIKVTITDTNISVRICAGDNEQQLDLHHADFAVIVAEVEARKRAIYAADDGPRRAKSPAGRLGGKAPFPMDQPGAP